MRPPLGSRQISTSTAARLRSSQSKTIRELGGREFISVVFSTKSLTTNPSSKSEILSIHTWYYWKSYENIHLIFQPSNLAAWYEVIVATGCHKETKNIQYNAIISKNRWSSCCENGDRIFLRDPSPVTCSESPMFATLINPLSIFPRFTNLILVKLFRSGLKQAAKIQKTGSVFLAVDVTFLGKRKFQDSSKACNRQITLRDNTARAFHLI